MLRCLEIRGMQVFRFMITFSLYMFRYYLCLNFIGIKFSFIMISLSISILSLLVFTISFFVFF